MPEFRLYYDDAGKVLGYSSDGSGKGKYIIIDSSVYHEGRFDIRIVDHQIVRESEFIILSKLVPSDSGIKCEIDDICVLTDIEPNIKWNIEINEYRRC